MSCGSNSSAALPTLLRQDLPPHVDRHGFRWRGGEVSRIEGFSDAVFALAVTLLIVSFQADTFAELRQAMSGFVAFAATFAILVWIWYEHYVFFRRYGMRDGITILLNCVLLLLVLFYVYPLKFMFSFLAALFLGIGRERWEEMRFSIADGQDLLIVYGLGFLGVFLVMALLHAHALRRQAELALSPRERYATGTQVGGALGNVAIAVVSILLAWLGPDSALAMAGFTYCLIGPFQGIWHYVRGRRGSRIAAPLTS